VCACPGTGVLVHTHTHTHTHTQHRSHCPSREWCDELMRACEERMIADKLYPCGVIYWFLPTYKEGKCVLLA
jgi:hypothetical protein